MNNTELARFAATDRQREIVAALEKEGGNRTRAAKALGLTREAIKSSIARIEARARSAGYAPESGWTHGAAPEGFRLAKRTQKLTPDGELLHEYVKTERDRAKPKPLPPEYAVKRISTNIDGQGTVVSQWTIAEPKEVQRFDAFYAAAERATERYRGVASLSAQPVHELEDGVTLYGLGDQHVGMLSWKKETGHDYDLKIAEEQLRTVSRRLVARTTPTRTAILANVGDFFHAEDDSQVTPGHGHKLDVDSRAGKVIEIGLTMMRTLVDLLLGKHELVYLVMVPGNHDPKLALMLRIWLKAIYENEPRVIVVDNRNPYMYLEIGKVLYGFTHGNLSKLEALPGLMAAHQKEAWGRTTTKIWITGHIHHKKRQEFAGRCFVESFNTLAPTDYWHHASGYGAAQSFQAITFNSCRETGRVSEDLLPK